MAVFEKMNGFLCAGVSISIKQFFSPVCLSIVKLHLLVQDSALKMGFDS